MRTQCPLHSLYGTVTERLISCLLQPLYEIVTEDGMMREKFRMKEGRVRTPLSAYARAMRCPCCAIPSTDTAYGALRCPVLSLSMVLCDARYRDSV
eukprot:968015-Rhodomonas_salina.3